MQERKGIFGKREHVHMREESREKRGNLTYQILKITIMLKLLKA